MAALSPDGRCKTFDASADGFGQGEGCGMIALKRLADAQADGDNVLAVVQGSAANHDGQARTVTTPSGPAQRAMLKDALKDAGIEPHQVDFIETHGTGTPLGDPIEVSAIGRVFCEDRENTLYLGAVKANVGHLDSAAGIAGVIKVVLSLQQKTIPPHRNFSEPNRHIPWDDWPIKIPLENTAWEGKERFAGISAFGMSGTNVHIIVGETPEPSVPHEERLSTSGTKQLFTFSARTEGALSDLAKRYADMLGADGSLEEVDVASLCYSAATARSHFSYRAAFAADDPLKLKHALNDFAAGRATPGAITGVAGRRAPKLALLFTGQGSQYVGMGKELYEAHPIFKATLDQCAKLFESHLEHQLLEVMWTSETLHQTEYTQPALFAIEYSLAKLFEEWGIVPDLLLGHSIGEYAAACVAGVFRLEDAVRMVAARGRLMQSLPMGGKMISVVTDEGLRQSYDRRISICFYCRVSTRHKVLFFQVKAKQLM
jgi:myxalamid-type polyketide synthase MxaB